MNPWGGVAGQCAAATVFLAIFAGFDSPVTLGLASAVCALVLVAAAMLVPSYAIDLRRGDAVARSPRRHAGDLLVAAECLAVMLPVAVATATGFHPLGTFDDQRGWRVPVATAAGSLGFMFAVFFASSLVDWWRILPRRDGLVTLPPCMSSGDVTWTKLTKTWLRHRMLAMLAFALVPPLMLSTIGLELVVLLHAQDMFILKVPGYIATLLGLILSFAKARAVVGINSVTSALPFGVGDTVMWRIKAFDPWESQSVRSFPLWKWRLLVRWDKRTVKGQPRPTSRGTARYVHDVSLDKATTFRMNRFQPGSRPLPEPVWITLLFGPGASIERQHVSYCLDAGGCLSLHDKCERDPEVNPNQFPSAPPLPAPARLPEG